MVKTMVAKVLTVISFFTLIIAFVLYSSGIISIPGNNIASLNFSSPNGGPSIFDIVLDPNDTAKSRAYILINPLSSSKNLTLINEQPPIKHYISKKDSAKWTKSDYKVDSIPEVVDDTSAYNANKLPKNWLGNAPKGKK